MPELRRRGDRARACDGCGGEGWIDPADDDPINYRPGYECWPCHDCACTGTEKWCPSCGHAMWHVKPLRMTEDR